MTFTIYTDCRDVRAAYWALWALEEYGDESDIPDMDDFEETRDFLDDVGHDAILEDKPLDLKLEIEEMYLIYCGAQILLELGVDQVMHVRLSFWKDRYVAARQSMMFPGGLLSRN
jgi:hypothetical protein